MSVVWRPISLGAHLLIGGRRLLRAIAAAPGHQDRPIRALDRLDLLALAAAVPYYRPRRVYMGAASLVAADLIGRKGLTTALELGPYRRPLITGADVMDIRLSPVLHTDGRQIAHDATVAPWPVADKAYDLFVALQVFEHLGTAQAAAFREVRRVARHAIVSLPIDWVMDDPRNCHHRIDEARVLGWFAPVVPSRVVLGNGGRRTRLVFVFEDLSASEADERPNRLRPTLGVPSS